MIKKIKEFIKKQNNTAPSSWKDSEYFDEAWKRRISALATFLEDEKRVLDLGCGKMWLKEMLPKEVQYIGCDYVERGQDTLVCDFNKKEFPAVRVDVCFVSGVLEYIQDTDWFLKNIKNCCNALIISYCTTDLHPSVKVRRLHNWVNDFSFEQLKEKIESKGFVLQKKGVIDNNTLMKFKAVINFV